MADTNEQVDEFKELKKKNKALRHHLKEEAATVERQNQEISQFKEQLKQKADKIEALQLDNQRLTKRIGILQEIENKRQQDSSHQNQSSGSYFGSSFFSGNNQQQISQIKEELEKVSEDLALAQEELIAKIQENEMVNIKIFEVEKEFYEKERSLEAKINDLQKRILQLDQDIQEKEIECQKLREELGIVRDQSEIMQQNVLQMENRYNEDQQKWGKLCERVTQQMDEHKFVYQQKFPIDPFRRDQIFYETQILAQELLASTSQNNQSSLSMQRKQFNMKNMIQQQHIQQNHNSINSIQEQDFNLFNVIKTDYKTQQRQKEIINVISEMSSQISQSMQKCMQSLISQIDGQKPVASNVEVVQYMNSGGFNQGAKGSSNEVNQNDMKNDQNQNLGQGVGSKGDISEQIMDSHGSRVKKYGIYIDQLVEKIKQVQNFSLDLFDIISVQSASLIDLQKSQSSFSNIFQQHNESSKDYGHQNEERERGLSSLISISQAAEKLQNSLNEIQDILENFYEEEQILFQAGIDINFQELSIKYTNDAILQNLGNLQQHLQILSTQKKNQGIQNNLINPSQTGPYNQKNSGFTFKQPNQINKYEIIELIVYSKFDQFTALFKGEIQSLAQNFLKKMDILKNEGCKLLINGQVSKSGMPFEVKSNNVMVFREQLVADFMEQSHLLERYHTACLSAKNLFQHHNLNNTPGRFIMQNHHHNLQTQNMNIQNIDKFQQQPKINIQLNINKSLMRAKNRMSNLGGILDKTQKAISYEERMRNMQLLELNKKEMIQLKSELFTIKKDYEKLDQEQNKQSIGYQKYKTLAKISQDKQQKQQVQLQEVQQWLIEVKQSINFEDSQTINSYSETQATSQANSVSGTIASQAQTNSSENDTFINQQLKNLDGILSQKNLSEFCNDKNSKNVVVDLKCLKANPFFNVQQILKLNMDPQSRYNQLAMQAMVPEDTISQFTIEQKNNKKQQFNFQSLNNQQQKKSSQVEEKTQMLPLNEFISSDLSKSQQINLLQQSYFQKLNQLTHKLHTVDKLSQGTSLQVQQKENEWKEKIQKIEKDFKNQQEQLKKEVEQAQLDKQLISKSYESQLQMMSEHIVELQQQQDQLSSQMVNRDDQKRPNNSKK